MPRQINLYRPSLREPQRHFVVRSMLQGLAAVTIALLALSGWALWRSAEMRRELGAAEAANRNEQQRLGQQLSTLPSSADATALEQELALARQQLAGQRAELAERLTVARLEGARPGIWLQRLAHSTPSVVWLTAVRSTGARIEIEGYTLQPEALRPWLDQLSSEAPGIPRELTAVAVERASGLPAGEGWSFRVALAAADPVPGAAR